MKVYGALALVTVMLFAASIALIEGFITPSLVGNLTSADLGFLGVLAFMASIAFYYLEREED